jgi:NAD(P)-dependent dehydrogenase (short-subunit alcohol dehydrogenase family)
MKGKTVLVTGATSGIGRVAALELARMGAQVVALGRDERKLAELGLPTIRADFSRLAEVRRAAAEVRERFGQLHVLLNNAGAIQGERTLTPDGYETTFAVNHLSYFLLTQELLPLLKASAPARVVNVASQASRARALELDDLNNERRWTKFGSYGRSKRANLIFTFELARRLEGTGVTANAVHPGGVRTGFGTRAGWVALMMKLGGPFILTPEQGAETLIWLCSDPSLTNVSGKYFYRKREIRAVGQAYDRGVQQGLWEASERFVRPAT